MLFAHILIYLNIVYFVLQNVNFVLENNISLAVGTIICNKIAQQKGVLCTPPPLIHTDLCFGPFIKGSHGPQTTSYRTKPSLYIFLANIFK